MVFSNRQNQTNGVSLIPQEFPICVSLKIGFLRGSVLVTFLHHHQSMQIYINVKTSMGREIINAYYETRGENVVTIYNHRLSCQ